MDEYHEAQMEVGKLSFICEKLQALGQTVKLISIHDPLSISDIGVSVGDMIIDYTDDISKEIDRAYDAFKEFYAREIKEASAKADDQAEAPKADQS